MSFDIDINDFIDSLINYDKLGIAAMNKAVAECAKSIERDAKTATPVDTGRLRNSIISNVGNLEATVSTNVEYAQHVEYGTHKKGARPYLRPAYEKNITTFEKKISDILGGK